MKLLKPSLLQPRSCNGFVLPLVLVVLAVMTLLAHTIAMRAQQAAELGSSARKEQDALLAIASTEAQVLFRVATAEAVPGGFYAANSQLLRVDGRRYLAVSGSTVRLLDTRGQVNITTASPQTLACLLGQFGIDAGRHGVLEARLRDYTDLDNLIAVGGAEAPQYLSVGKLAPRNAQLRNVFELGRVDGWERVVNARSVVGNRFVDVGGIQPRGNFALNAAPRESLMCMLGVTGDSADRLIEARRTVPLLRKEAAQGILVDAAELLEVSGGFFHGRIMSVAISYPGYPKTLEYNLSCEPPTTETSSPCRLEYSAWRVQNSPETGTETSQSSFLAGTFNQTNRASDANAFYTSSDPTRQPKTPRTQQPFEYPPTPLPEIASAAESAVVAQTYAFRF
jgi:general secretion pathway protein K